MQKGKERKNDDFTFVSTFSYPILVVYACSCVVLSFHAYTQLHATGLSASTCYREAWKKTVVPIAMW